MALTVMMACATSTPPSLTPLATLEHTEAWITEWLPRLASGRILRGEIVTILTVTDVSVKECEVRFRMIWDAELVVGPDAGPIGPGTIREESFSWAEVSTISITQSEASDGLVGISFALPGEKTVDIIAFSFADALANAFRHSRDMCRAPVSSEDLKAKVGN